MKVNRSIKMLRLALGLGIGLCACELSPVDESLIGQSQATAFQIDWAYQDNVYKYVNSTEEDQQKNEEAIALARCGPAGKKRRAAKESDPDSVASFVRKVIATADISVRELASSAWDKVEASTNNSQLREYGLNDVKPSDIPREVTARYVSKGVPLLTQTPAFEVTLDAYVDRMNNALRTSGAPMRVFTTKFIKNDATYVSGLFALKVFDPSLEEGAVTSTKILRTIGRSPRHEPTYRRGLDVLYAYLSLEKKARDFSERRETSQDSERNRYAATLPRYCSGVEVNEFDDPKWMDSFIDTVASREVFCAHPLSKEYVMTINAYYSKNEASVFYSVDLASIDPGSTRGYLIEDALRSAWTTLIEQGKNPLQRKASYAFPRTLTSQREQVSPLQTFLATLLQKGGGAQLVDKGRFYAQDSILRFVWKSFPSEQELSAMQGITDPVATMIELDPTLRDRHVLDPDVRPRTLTNSCVIRDLSRHYDPQTQAPLDRCSKEAQNIVQRDYADRNPPN